MAAPTIAGVTVISKSGSSFGGGQFTFTQNSVGMFSANDPTSGVSYYDPKSTAPGEATYTPGGALNLTSQFISFGVNFSRTPFSQYATKALKGITVRLYSSGTEYKEFSVGGSDSILRAASYGSWAVLVIRGDASNYITQTSGFNPANITKIAFRVIEYNDVQNRIEVYFNSLLRFSAVTISGGDSTNKGSFQYFFDYFDNTVSSYLYQKQGSSQYLMRTPIVVSSDYFSEQNLSIEFAGENSNGSFVNSFYNDNLIGLSITAGINIFSQCSFSSSKPFPLSISGGTTTFSGGVFSNIGNNSFTATTFKGSIFVGCAKLSGSGLTLINCTIDKSNDAVAAYKWVDGQSIVGCSFTNHTIPAGAIQIDATGTCYLSSNAFSENTKDFNVTATIGTVRIVVDAASTTDYPGGFSAPGYIAAKVQTAGATVVIQTPVIAVSAPNFAQNTRVQVARLEPYSVASSSISTGGSGIITISNNRFKSAAFPTLVYFQLQSGATLPTSSPQIQNNTLYYVVASGTADGLSAGQFKISLTQGGTPITFSNAGSGNFTFTGITELDNSLAGSSGYSNAITEPNGTLIRVSAQPWQNSSGCTAGKFYQQNFVWSSTAGLTIADTVSISATPDTVHNFLIGTQLTVFNSLITLPSDGSTVAGISFDAQGTISLDARAVSNALLTPEAAYLYTVYARSTQAGIRIIGSQFAAQDNSNFVFSGLKLDNIADGVRNTPGTPLTIAGGYVATSDGSNPIKAGSGAIYLNADQRGVAIAYTAASTIAPTQQQIRDALALAATATPVIGSIDEKLNAGLIRIGD